MRRVSWKGIQRRTKSAQRQTKVVERCPIEAMTAGRAACVFTGDQRGQRSAAGGRRGVACRHAAWFRRARRRNPDTSSAFLAPRQIGAPAVAGRRRLVADGAAWPVQALMATLTQAGIGMARKRLCALRSIWRSSHAGCRYQSFDCAAGLRRLRVLRSTPLNGSSNNGTIGARAAQLKEVSTISILTSCSGLIGGVSGIGNLPVVRCRRTARYRSQ